MDQSIVRERGVQPGCERDWAPWTLNGAPRLERGGRLLFPAFGDGREQMLTDVRKLLDRLGQRRVGPG